MVLHVPDWRYRCLTVSSSWSYTHSLQGRVRITGHDRRDASHQRKFGHLHSFDSFDDFQPNTARWHHSAITQQASHWQSMWLTFDNRFNCVGTAGFDCVLLAGIHRHMTIRHRLAVSHETRPSANTSIALRSGILGDGAMIWMVWVDRIL